MTENWARLVTQNITYSFISSSQSIWTQTKPDMKTTRKEIKQLWPKLQRAARAIPDAKFVLMSSVGHVPPMERPNDFGRAVVNFINEKYGVRV